MTASPQVLVVEDHDDLAEALQVNLRREGYRADVARDGRQALALIRKRPPDVVVLDLGLPGLDGFGVLKQLREADCWCPVLILTARDADTDKVEGFRLGADDYVTKPFRTLELLARIGALARRALRDRTERAAEGGATSDADVGADEAEASPAVAVTAPRSSIGWTDEELVGRYGLTLRQAEVARLLSDGLSNPEIAEALNISRFTARNHTEQVLAKLDLPTRARVAVTLRADWDRERGFGRAPGLSAAGGSASASPGTA